MESRTLLTDQVTEEESLFDLIYDAAKKGDETKLSLIAKTAGRKNYKKDFMTSPISQLASEGEHEAVKLLLKVNLGEMQAVIRGYALSGDTEHLEVYRSKIDFQVENISTFYTPFILGSILGGHEIKDLDTLLENDELLGMATFAYAIRKNYSQVEKCIARGADIDFAALGYSIAEDLDHIEDAIKRGATVDIVVHGLALSERADLVKHFIFERGGKFMFASSGYDLAGEHAHKHKEALINFFFQTIKQYALEGNVDQVKKLKSLYANSVYFISLVPLMYAISGHQHVIDLYQSDPYFLIGLAIGNHVALLNNLLLKREEERKTRSHWLQLAPRFTFYDFALTGYVIAGNKKEIDNMLAKGAQIDSHCLYHVCKDLEYLNNPEKMLQILAFCDEKNRERLCSSAEDLEPQVIKMKKNNAEVTHTEEPHKKKNNPLVSTSTKLNTAMKQHQLNYQQAQAWIVPALQIWLLQGQQAFQGLLPFELLLSIASFVSPLTQNDTQDLFNKMKFHIRVGTYQTSLIKELTNYSASSNFLKVLDFKKHKKRANSLLEECKKATSKAEINTLLTHQLSLFNQTNPGNKKSKKPHEKPVKHLPGAGSKDEYVEILKKFHTLTTPKM